LRRRASRKVYAIGGLNKGSPDEYLTLISWLCDKQPDAKIFVGTNSFRQQLDAGDHATVKGYLEVLRRADIVSMNEAELDQLHEASFGKRSYRRDGKLIDLRLPGISVCHASDGAIARLSGWPSGGGGDRELFEGYSAARCGRSLALLLVRQGTPFA